MEIKKGAFMLKEKMKKIILVLLMFSLLILSGCGKSKDITGDIVKERSGDNQQKIEQSKKDLEEIEGRIAYVEEFSKQVQEQRELLKQVDDCVQNKLIQQGYEDGINCIIDYDNPLCENTERRDAEVNATNECYDIYDPDKLRFFRLFER